MKILGRVLGATCLIAALAGPVWAQSAVPRYGETDKDKTPSEIAAEKEAERAYRRSLGNIPEQQKSTDPWGTVRSDSAPPKAAAKDTAKAPPAKPKAKSADGAAR